MTKVKKIIFILFIIINLTLSFIFPVSSLSDNSDWENTALFTVVRPSQVTNSTLENAFVHVEYRYSENRIHMLFMLTFNDFDDDSNIKLVLNLNQLGKVTVCADGSTQYNPDIYFARLDAEAADPISKSVHFEITVGIKSGLEVINAMELTIYDSFGVPSNTQLIDITDPYAVEEENEEPNRSESVKSVTSKTKSSKRIATKKHTKTTTAKSTTVSVEEITYNIIDSAKDDKHIKNSKNSFYKPLIYISAGIVFASIVAGCFIALKKNQKSDEEK